MYKKVLVLFLLLGTSVILLPSEGKAADINNTINTVSNATPGNSANIPQNRRRWRNRRWEMRKKRWNRRSNRRDDRRDNRRDRRRDRRDDRRDRRN